MGYTERLIMFQKEHSDLDAKWVATAAHLGFSVQSAGPSYGRSPLASFLSTQIKPEPDTKVKARRLCMCLCMQAAQRNTRGAPRVKNKDGSSPATSQTHTQTFFPCFFFPPSFHGNGPLVSHQSVTSLAPLFSCDSKQI